MSTTDPQSTSGSESLRVTLLGTGSPIPDAHRAGPSTLVTAGSGLDASHYLVDAGRGVLMRLAGAGVAVGQLSAVLITHMHSDHITDLSDVITTRWVMGFEPTPLVIVGPHGTREMVDHILAMLGPDIGYRMAHHADLDYRPPLEVIEVEEGRVDLPGGATVWCAPTDHKPVHPSIGFRFEHDGTAAVLAGDTIPCEGLDRLCSVDVAGEAAPAGALVHTVIRKDVIGAIGLQRLTDTMDYHSSPEEAAQTAARNGVGTLVLTHFVPTVPPVGGDDWRDLAAGHFEGEIVIGEDLLSVAVAGAHSPISNMGA
ncbi:MAG: MBL fold metallo-hydrolase [Acidimicrobiales bacterium]|nr:MBL fold metallo-hydrolase [Acidimicrobiales bacterium]